MNGAVMFLIGFACGAAGGWAAGWWRYGRASEVKPQGGGGPGEEEK